jgi:hypothetical protein
MTQFRKLVAKTFRPSMRATRALLALSMVGAFAISCKDSNDPGVLSTLVVAPNPATVAAGATVQFTATGTDFTGASVVPNPGAIVWSVAAGGGTINSTTGLFTASTTPGTYTNTVVATCRGISATATVIITAGPLATITVTPSPTLVIGAQQQFTAVGKDGFGNVVAITPVWTTTNPPGTIVSTTGLFTAGNTLGVFASSVTATSGAISGKATVTVIAGPVSTITVTPNPATMATGAQQQFTAVGKDAGGNVVPITPVWTTTNPPGTINSSTGLFTAGSTAGTFPDAVTATSGGKSGTATVIVTTVAPPAPVPVPPIPATVAAFRMIARVAWTCTNGSIVGNIGTNQTASEVPPGAITQTLCPITGGTPQLGTSAAKAAYQDFLTAYTSDSTIACGTTLTGTLAGQILAPGVYCFDASATLTGTLTLAGPSTGVWLFKIGNLGTGALTGTNFNVVMAGGASDCNVTWWVKDGSTMTTSNFKGAILAGAGVSFSGGTFEGSAYSKQDVTVTGTPVTACAP